MDENSDNNTAFRGLWHAVVPALLAWVVVGALLAWLVVSLPGEVLSALAVALLVLGAGFVANVAASRHH